MRTIKGEYTLWDGGQTLWDKEMEKLNQKYKELFPEPRCKFSFKELVIKHNEYTGENNV